MILCLLFSSAAGAFAEGIENPYQYVWDDEGDLEGITRFFLDINGDQTPELFIGANSLIGNGGGEFHVFLKSGKSYNHLGSVFCSPGGLDVLATKHNGFSDLRTCTHMSAEECTLTIYIFSGEKYEPKSQKLVKASDLPKDFKPIRVEAEQSGKTLKWAP